MFTFKDEYNLVYNNNFEDFMKDTKGAVEVFDSKGELSTTTVSTEEELRQLFDRYLVEDENGIIAYSCEGNDKARQKLFTRLNAKYGSEHFKPFLTVEDRANELAKILTIDEDNVNHPTHYNMHSIEPIDVVEDWELNFNLGSVIKYISRAKYKGHELEDLKKAQWYLNREISRLEKIGI